MMEILSVILDTKYVMHRLEKSNIPILVMYWYFSNRRNITMLEYCRNHNFLRVCKSFPKSVDKYYFLNHSTLNYFVFLRVFFGKKNRCDGQHERVLKKKVISEK